MKGAHHVLHLILPALPLAKEGPVSQPYRIGTRILYTSR